MAKRAKRKAAAASTENGQPAVNKSQAIRDVLAQGVSDVSEVIAKVKETHGVEVGKALVYQAKAKLAAQNGRRPRRRRRRKASAAPNPAAVPTPRGVVATIEAARTLIRLAGGPRHARAVIDALAGQAAG